MLLLLLIVSIAFSQLKVLSTEGNEGAFAVKDRGRWFCFAGRKSSENSNYDALLGVCEGGCRIFSVSSPEDDYSYTVEEFGNLCIGGITTLARGSMDIVLTLFGREGILRHIYLGGKEKDMLWFLRRVRGGYLLVGGVQDTDWDILVIKLSEELSILWVKRFSTGAEEYAYGVVEHEGIYFVVGRSNFRGNWDAFILGLSPEGKLLWAKLLGGEGKDYLRYVGTFGNEVLAVGRSELKGDSDLLLLLPRSGLYKLYDGGDLDYGRAFSETKEGLLLVGEIWEGGDSEGMVLHLNTDLKVLKSYALGGEGIESLRHIDGDLIGGYTYSFTLDNDILLGKFREYCGRFLKRKDFRKRERELRFFPYPLREKDYEIERLNLKLITREIKVREIDPCQE
jgi:hypothetical protein